MDMPQENTEPVESGDPVGGEGDISQGYCVRFEVTPNGFSVSEPEPLSAPSEYSEGQEADESAPAPVPDLTTAIKELLHVVKAHPLGNNPVADLQAGYGSDD